MFHVKHGDDVTPAVSDLTANTAYSRGSGRRSDDGPRPTDTYGRVRLRPQTRIPSARPSGFT
ncbi:hypothetical protein CH267_05895 [Rhodococcus sp. 06-621-2]|nr:hypothetical protein CH267_05895 [Rhodococcus sp. 06-621-2]